MKLVIASNNSHKIYEIKQILSGKFDGILSLSEAGVEHETVEDGKTFMENALKKALSHNCQSIAFPLISTGNYGFPKDRALQIAISAFTAFLREYDLGIRAGSSADKCAGAVTV